MVISAAIFTRSIAILFAASMLAGCPIALADDTVDFEHQIAPILLRRCAGCHNPSENAGGLNLLTLETARAGGKTGDPAGRYRQ